MNEFLREFIMQGIRDMIARKVELYRVYQYAVGWYEKNVLLEEDLREIQNAYSAETEENVSTDEEKVIEDVGEEETSSASSEVESDESID